MEDDALINRLTPILRDIFENDDLELYREMTARDVDAWDSLSNIRMLVAVEQELGIQFNTAEIAGLPDLGALLDVIREHLSA